MAYGGAECVMAAVCDGMGGLDMGEVSSSEVIRTFEDWFSSNAENLISRFNPEVTARHWCEMLEGLNRDIRRFSLVRDTETGTTFTGILMVNESFMAVHVGDSRIYHIGSEIRQLTKDHTFVEREVESGRMTGQEALADNRRNLLLQCVGASGRIEPQIVTGKVRTGTYLLCTDGFRHEISPPEMKEVFNAKNLKSKSAMKKEGRRLIDQAIKRGEKDNISLILIKKE